MRNNFVVLILFLISLASASSSYIGYKSLINQKILLQDLNTNTVSFDLVEAVRINSDYPNITITAIPIKSLIANYLVKENKLGLAKSFLYKALDHNPYIKITESILAEVYLRERLYDSAYYFSSSAFNKIPNSVRHLTLYLKSAVNVCKYEDIIKSFKTIEQYNNEQQFVAIAAGLYNFKDTDPIKEEIDSIFDKIYKRFPNNFTIKQLRKSLILGEKKLKEISIYAELGNEAFQNKNYIEASKNFKKAFYIDRESSVFLENYIVSEFESNHFEKSLKLTDSFLNKYNFKSEKIELLRASSLYKIGQVDKACKYLNTIRATNNTARIFYYRNCK